MAKWCKVYHIIIIMEKQGDFQGAIDGGEQQREPQRLHYQDSTMQHMMQHQQLH